jgi:3-isopropylmalate/(R)-2-methylmalate dehydratase small subunit
VSDSGGVVARFEIDPFRKKCLLGGLDRIGLTLQNLDDIAAYEQKRWPELAHAG